MTPIRTMPIMVPISKGEPTMKHGTRIEVRGLGMDWSETWERATIFTRAPKAWGPVPGKCWHRVKFADGGILCVHEESFRVVDNRAE